MRLATLGFGFATLLAGTTFATAASKPEEAIRYRQAAFTMIGWNFGTMGEMAKGKSAWDATAFARHAERVGALAPQVPEGFPTGSDKGAKTGAKPEIWKDPADFQAKMDAFIQQAQALASTARGGDEEAMKAQFGKTAETCKACHQKYRSRD